MVELFEAGLNSFRIQCNRSDFVATMTKLIILFRVPQLNGFWFYIVLNTFYHKHSNA